MLRHNNELKADISIVTKENYVAKIKAVELEIFVTTEKFYVVTKNGREVRWAKASFSRQGNQCCNKKFSQRKGLKKIMLRNGKSLSRHRVQSQQYKIIQLYCDKEKVCRDNKSMLLGETLS